MRRAGPRTEVRTSATLLAAGRRAVHAGSPAEFRGRQSGDLLVPEPRRTRPDQAGRGKSPPPDQANGRLGRGVQRLQLQRRRVALSERDPEQIGLVLRAPVAMPAEPALLPNRPYRGFHSWQLIERAGVCCICGSLLRMPEIYRSRLGRRIERRPAVISRCQGVAVGEQW